MIFDLLCLGLALLFALWGAMRGLVRQVFGVVGFIAGVLLARLFAGDLGEAFHNSLGMPPNVAAVVFGVAIFFVTELVAKIVGNLLTGALGSFTGGMNRAGGGALGLAKGLLVVWVVASLAALAQPHLGKYDKKYPGLRKLDLEHSHAVAVAKDFSVLGDKGKELRARAEREVAASRRR